MTFDTPLMLWLAPAVALALLALAAWARGTRVRYARRWSPELERRAVASGRWSAAALGVAGLFAAVALAGPRWGTRVITAETKSLNLVVAMDISRSMLAEDVPPSRLERAKREARRLVHDLAGDRIGLVGFAGRSYILAPLTIDGSAVQLWLEALDPAVASAGGTELARALRQGRDLLFATGEVADRVLVVFTDGEAHDSLSTVIAEAERLRRHGVRLILVAQGRRDPVRIPIRDERGDLVGYQRDPTDRVVETTRRDDVLYAVADAAQGVVVAAELGDQAGAVRDLVANYRRVPQSGTAAARDISRAWLPALAAVLVLLGHTVSRRSWALAALLLGVGWRPAAAQAPTNPADEAWRRGAFRDAAEHYLAQAKAGEGGDTTWFNLGTAAMAIGDTAVARQALGRAAGSLEPGLRFRALYNLGLLELRVAARDSATRRARLEAAIRHYRQALLLVPSDRAAKWNLELALRHLPPPPAGGAAAAQGAGSGGESDVPPPAGAMTRAQAEQLLDSMADAERQARREQVRRSRQSGETRGRREW